MLDSFQESLCFLHLLSLVKNATFFGLWGEKLLLVDRRHGARYYQACMATLRLVSTEDHAGLLNFSELLFRVDGAVFRNELMGVPGQVGG